MSSTSSEERVLAIADELRQAMIDNEADVLRARVAEDYRGSDAGGRVHGRDEYLQAYGPGGVKLDLFDVIEIETTAWADTVLVGGEARIRGLFGEFEFEHHLRFLDIYARRSTEWQLVASHICDIAPEP